MKKVKKWSQRGLRKGWLPKTPRGLPGGPLENHQNHQNWRWILHTSNEILTFSLWGCFGGSIAKNEKIDVFLSTFQKSMSWICYKNWGFFNDFKKHVFSKAKKNVSKKGAFWPPWNSNNLIITMVFEGFSFSKKHRFLETRKLEKSENELPTGDVWKKQKKRKITTPTLTIRPQREAIFINLS